MPVWAACAMLGSSERRSSELRSAVRAPRGCQGSSSVSAGEHPRNTPCGTARRPVCCRSVVGLRALWAALLASLLQVGEGVEGLPAPLRNADPDTPVMVRVPWLCIACGMCAFGACCRSPT